MAQYTFDSSLFSQTINNSAMTSTPLPPPTVEAMPTTIKMEMIENYEHSPSPAHHSSNSSEASQTPAPESNGSKPVKKRKSWGQVLPEPKTSLPPRKRAKTEDEKEQRRIERVKRNRLAAHNSRERKRQEYEVLQTEKDELEANMQAYKQKMAEMEAELRYYRSKYPGEAPQPVFDLSTPPSDTFDTICPAQIPTSFPSPESMDSMDSPRDSSCQPETPPSSFEASPEFDSTQYPAAILCDLPCQSTSGASLRAIWAYLSLFNLTLQSTKSLSLWRTSSTSTRSQSAVQQRLLPWNPLLAWSILLQSMPSVHHPSTTALTQTLMAFLTALMQSSTTCRVPLAQLRLATRPSQRDNFSTDATKRSTKGAKKQAELVDGGCGSRMMRASRPRQLGRRKVRSLRLTGALGWENMECGITTGRRMAL
jgi:transcriptional activator HAC1